MSNPPASTLLTSLKAIFSKVFASIVKIKAEFAEPDTPPVRSKRTPHVVEDETPFNAVIHNLTARWVDIIAAMPRIEKEDIIFPIGDFAQLFRRKIFESESLVTTLRINQLEKTVHPTGMFNKAILLLQHLSTVDTCQNKVALKITGLKNDIEKMEKDGYTCCSAVRNIISINFKDIIVNTDEDKVTASPL